MSASAAITAPSTGARLTRFSLVRIVLAALATIVPVALILILAHQIPDKSMRWLWPQLLAAAACVAGYVFYVRKIEQRDATELSRPGAVRELGTGVLGGAGLFAVIVGALAVGGNYTIFGHNGPGVMVGPFVETVLAALFEEILFRGVLFRVTERSLGTRAAVVISSVLFALAHLPNEGITALAVGATFVAGIFFAAAYLATRRLWLAVGLHFGWNFVSDAVFSVTTSGHPANGLLQARLTGAEWLSGGIYGIEGSALTVVVMALGAVYLFRLAARRNLIGRASQAAALA
jgi:membrane protease YdiL (CAAX protease family)